LLSKGRPIKSARRRLQDGVDWLLAIGDGSPQATHTNGRRPHPLPTRRPATDQLEIDSAVGPLEEHVDRPDSEYANRSLQRNQNPGVRTEEKFAMRSPQWNSGRVSANPTTTAGSKHGLFVGRRSSAREVTQTRSVWPDTHPAEPERKTGRHGIRGCVPASQQPMLAGGREHNAKGIGGRFGRTRRRSLSFSKSPPSMAAR